MSQAGDRLKAEVRAEMAKENWTPEYRERREMEEIERRRKAEDERWRERTVRALRVGDTVTLTVPCSDGEHYTQDWEVRSITDGEVYALRTYYKPRSGTGPVPGWKGLTRDQLKNGLD